MPSGEKFAIHPDDTKFFNNKSQIASPVKHVSFSVARQHLKYVIAWPLWFTINTNSNGQGKFTIKADPDKIRRLRNKLFAIANSRKASRKDLERLLGHGTRYHDHLWCESLLRNILAICNDPTYNGVLDDVRFKSYV